MHIEIEKESILSLPSETASSLKFGLLCDSLTLQQWQVDTVKLLIENDIQLKVLILNENETEKPSFFEKWWRYPYRRLLFRVWSRFFFKPKARFPKSINPLLPENVIVLKAKTTQKSGANYFSETMIRQLKEQKLDFLLRFGFDIIRGEILTVAKYGVWSFHHDDEMFFRGTPPGFWEFVNGIDKNGVILQRLTDKLDKGFILKKVYFKTIKHAYKAHLDQLLFESSCMPLQVCKQLLAEQKLPEYLSESKAKIYKPPVNLKMIYFCFLSVYRRIAFHFHDLFFQEDWNVGFVWQAIETVVQNGKIKNEDVHWLQKPAKTQYLADPTLFRSKDETYLFFEWYDYKKGKACLANAKQSENFELYHKILETPYHLSFPFVFGHEGMVYCIPESSCANRVELYRFDERQNKLLFETVLLGNIQAVDPVLYWHEGLWYLFLTKKEQANTQLFIFYSEVLKGSFKEHFNNPVKTDIASARSAGRIFAMGDRLVRPSQDSAAHYGSALILNEIKELTPEVYHEETFARIAPIASSVFDKGIHTLNGDAQMTVFDGKRFHFTFKGLKQQWRQKRKKNA
ncbi:MAG: hypothetical protein LBM67_00200 [Lentimicrobiaceae bacterium]|nr:hypothetical protein [Lentimicrobiaceae bacterium]